MLNQLAEDIPADAETEITNLNQTLLTAMDSNLQQTCFYVQRGRRYQAISYGRFLKLTMRLANFLRKQDISNGERVAIVADNPLEWMVVYVACLLSGGVVVPLQAWLPADTIQAMIKNSGATLALVQNGGQSHIITQAGQDLPKLKTVIVVEEETRQTFPNVIPITSILAKATTTAEEEAIRGHAQNINPDALALIYYKARTQKGVMFTHAQRLAAMQSLAGWFTFDEDDVAMTTILSWSLYTLDTALYYFLSGVPHVLTEGTDLLAKGLQQTTPTVGVTTPSGLEEFYNEVMTEVSQWSASRRTLFQWALSVGKEYRAAGLGASDDLRDEFTRADRAIFSRIRAKYGGTTMRRVYSTGAPLPDEWADFMEIIIGTRPLNIYSLTEAGGFPTVSHPDSYRTGACGQVTAGFQVRIADDDEILVRGPSVMQGYWQQPEAGRAVLDEDGWLHTGDLGRFDQDGFLYLTGHKQSQLVLSTGRKIRPARLRDELTATPYIAQAVIVGDGRPYVSALIVPNLPAIAASIKGTGTIDTPEITITHPGAKQLIDEAINRVNKHLDNWRQIKTYRLLEQPLTEASGELTASQKICYDVVVERYQNLIEEMYPTPIQMAQTDITKVQLEPEELRELLEKQDILDAWLADAGIGFLFDLAQEKGIDAPSMVHLSETVAAIAQMQNEEKPLSTALIVGYPPHIVRYIPESEIQLHRYDHIRRMRQIVVTMAKMVDGLVLGYVVDKHGFVRGIHKLGQSQKISVDDDFLLGPQFRHHAALSKQCDAIIFFVPAGGRQVRVFAGGQLVGRYANGSWSTESISRLDEAVTQLAEQRGYALPLLQRIIRCAFQMSEKNQGAIFLLGDADLILENSDPPEISSFASIRDADFNQLSDQQLPHFAKPDGATVIDVQGRFRGGMVLLRPDADTQAEIGPGKGARHSSAAKMSAEANCLAITVSQDGPITVYESGQRIFSL